MNKEYVLFNLIEVQEEIGKTIAEIQAEPDYEYGDYVVAMSHMYHHLNTAWNARDASKEAAETCSETDFAKWRSMPTNSELLLEV